MLDARYLILDGSRRPKAMPYKAKVSGFKFRKCMTLRSLVIKAWNKRGSDEQDD